MSMRSFLSVLILTLIVSPALAREYIRAVGSSTVFPFVAAGAEEFGRTSKFRTPVVESTGTGGGFKLFCTGLGNRTPDLVNASRAIKPTERAMCAEQGVTDILELALGYDGIVMANARGAAPFDLTLQQLFLALAWRVPQDGALIPNPYRRWRDIDPALPDTPIMVYGPPPTSGTRDAFVELVMHKACKAFPEFKTAHPDKKARKRACSLLREDGGYIEAGENDNLIIQKLTASPEALGIFGYSFLEQNSDKVQGSKIHGAPPEFAKIASGAYPVSRPLYVYVKTQHAPFIPGLAALTREFTGDAAIGEEGYLIYKGLIPLPTEKRAAQRERVEQAVTAGGG